jgi:ATP dependent DNA ligase C terminal region
MESVVVVGVLPLAKLVVEDLSVVDHHVVQQLVELLGVDAVGAFELAVEPRRARLSRLRPGRRPVPTIYKCGTGFSDAELAALPARLARLPRAQRPARVDSHWAADVWFEPTLVVEVLAAELTLPLPHSIGPAGLLSYPADQSSSPTTGATG